MFELYSVSDAYQKALQIRKKTLGINHPDTATSYNNIGLVYHMRGNDVKELKFYQQALQIREKVLGTDHPDTAISYHNIGAVYFEQGDYNEALKWLEKALAVRLKFLGTKHPATKNTQQWIDKTKRWLPDKE